MLDIFFITLLIIVSLWTGYIIYNNSNMDLKTMKKKG